MDLLGLAFCVPFFIGAIMSAMGHNFTDYEYLKKAKEHDDARR